MGNLGGLDQPSLDRSWADYLGSETEQDSCNHNDSVTQADITCECIDTRIGEIYTQGGHKPAFILQLHSEEINGPLIKYFNCVSKTKSRYTVPHNSDFAKLYRLTLGQNPTKRFSKAHQLLSHFLGYRFIATLKQETLKNGQHYFKATHIEPETLCKNDAWTTNGTLKKSNKPMKTGGEVATSRRKTARQRARKTGDK